MFIKNSFLKIITNATICSKNAWKMGSLLPLFTDLSTANFCEEGNSMHAKNTAIKMCNHAHTSQKLSYPTITQEYEEL